MEKIKIITKNKRAYFDYFILDEIECGIVLRGTEIKSIRLGKVSINDSYCQVKKGIMYIYDMHISLYDFGNIFNHDEKRDKVLLLHKKEIRKLENKVKLEGLTIIPLVVYLKDGLCKVKIALCKGKKNYDKRDELKKSTVNKEIKKY